MGPAHSFEDYADEQLLKYIDIPYFRNNPSYIKLWRSYYEQTKRIEVLLLMYHKQISTYYHWIYVELSKHFIRVGKPELAHYVLTEALRNNVYDSKCVEEALGRVPPFERRYTRGDMACVLNQKNLRVLGTIWNSYEEELFYDKNHEPGTVNFEMMKARAYLSAAGGDWNEYGRVALKKPLQALYHEDTMYTETLVYHAEPITVTENGHTGNAEASARNVEQQENIWTTQDNNLAEEYAQLFPDEARNEQAGGHNCIESLNIGDMAGSPQLQNCAAEETKSSAPEELDSMPMQEVLHAVSNNHSANIPELQLRLCQISGNPEVDQELIIDDFIHIIQARESDTFLTMCIASNTDLTQTIAGKTFLIRPIEYESASTISKESAYSFFELNGRLFVMFEYNKLESLQNILKLCNSTSCLFYFSQVLAILLKYTGQGIVPTQLDFYVDTNFSVVLSVFSFAPLDTNNFNTMYSCLQDIFKGFEIAFEQDLATLASAIRSKTLTLDFKREVLKHKSTLLNTI